MARKATAIPGGGGGGAWTTADGQPGDPKYAKGGKSTDVNALAQLDMFGEMKHSGAQKSTLGEEFLLPPFSVLNAREGWWQDRKRAWLAIGIKSELGRGELIENDPDRREEINSKSSFNDQDRLNRMKRYNAACPGGSPLPGKGTRKGYEPGQGKDGTTKAGKNFARTFGQDLMRGEHVVQQQTSTLNGGLTFRTTMQPYRDPDGEAGPAQTGTSIFDPVLCECIYRWFCPPGGVVLDPFAGGSVRGVVASHLGLQYVGVELRAEQVAANKAQLDIARDPLPDWRQGDSRFIAKICEDIMADGIISCPPYADLERYSDDPADISTLDYGEFRKAYAEIIQRSVFRLKRNAFATFVVGEVRGKNGGYVGFVPDTIAAFREAGLMFWNEAILVTAVGSLPVRAGKQFRASRALGRTHQAVLTFVKGDPKEAAAYLAHKDKEWK